MSRILTVFSLFSFSSPALAYIECTYTPKQVMMDNTGDSVWMCFDEGLCIKAYKDQVGEKIIDRTFSMGMAAISGNKRLRVRFNADDFNCETASGSHSDYSMIWYLK